MTDNEVVTSEYIRGLEDAIDNTRRNLADVEDDALELVALALTVSDTGPRRDHTKIARAMDRILELEVKYQGIVDGRTPINVQERRKP